MVTPRKVGGTVWHRLIEEAAEMAEEGLNIADKFFEGRAPGPAQSQQLAGQIMRQFSIIQSRLLELERIVDKEG